VGSFPRRCAGRRRRGSGAAAHPDQRDGVDGAAEGPVAAAAVPVPDGHAAAGLDRAGAAEGGERGLAMAPARWEKLTMACAALTGPTPNRLGR
jgi:hypothetical protein